MKFLFLPIAIIILFSSCTDFFHLQYRKLNKVPAHPEWITGNEKTQPFLKNEKTQNIISVKQNENRRSSPCAINSIVSTEKNAAKNFFSKNKFLRSKISGFEKCKIHGNVFSKIKSRKKSPGDDSFVIGLIVIILLGLLVISGGIWMLFAGIAAGTLWMIICGPLIILLGLPFVIGLVTFCFVGDRTRKIPVNYSNS